MSGRVGHMREAGSLVVEAAVGIGLLVMITTSLATVVPAVLDAHDRAAAHHEVLRIGEDVVEHVGAGMQFEGTDGDVEVVIARETQADGTCSTSGVAGARSSIVRLVHTGRFGSREVLLRVAETPRATPDAPAAMRVHRPPNVIAQLAAITGDQEVMLVDGEASGGRDGCAKLPVTAAGRYELAPEDPASPLIGPTHLLLRDHPVSITFDGRSVDRDLRIDAAAHLTVGIDPSGARIPDVVSTGGLLWTVRGDDARVATPLGVGRPVHPGAVTVVVSACRSAESIGSPLRLVVGAGEVRDAVVPLATVTLTGIGTRAGWTLNASRSTECIDDSTRRPSLAWSGGLHDGMRIALPRGLWQLSLTTPGMPESPRLLVPVGDPDLVVVMR